MRVATIPLAFLLVAISTPRAALHAQAPTQEPDAAVRIAIDPSYVTSNEVHLASTPKLAADERTARIEPLIQQLKAPLQDWSRLHPEQPFPGQVSLDIDAAVAYRVVRKVLFSIEQSGHTGVRVARSGVTLDWRRDQPVRPALAAIWMKPSGYVLGSGELQPIDKRDSRYDALALRKRLMALRKLQTSQGRLVIAPDDEIAFVDVAEAMKTAVAAGYSQIDLIEGGTPAVIISRDRPHGSLSKTAIRTVIGTGMGALRACYASYLARPLDATAVTRGRIKVKFVIAESGRVGIAAVDETDFHDNSLIGCVVGVARGLKFPPPEGGGIVVVTYPFVFGSAEPEEARE